MSPPPVLLIHGGFCGGWAFKDFAIVMRAGGVAASAIDLPGHGAKQRTQDVAGLSMRDYAGAVASAAAASPSPPVLIGHSLGGLVALMAAAEAKTAGVILLAPSAPWGVAGSTLEEAASAFSLFALGPYWTRAIAPEYGPFRRWSVDRLPRSERRAVFARLGLESGRALFETLNWWLDPAMTTRVDPSRIAAPILAIAGGKDAVHPPATVRQTAQKVGAALEVMEEMSHWLIGEPGWREVAARCLAFVHGVGAARLAAE